MRARATDLPAVPVEIDAYLQAILDSVALPVWVVDHSGRVLLANPAALAAVGYELSELVGRNGHETVHYLHPDGSPYPAEDCPVLQPIRTGEPLSNDEDWFIRRDGTMFPVSYTVVPIDLPAGRGAVMTFIDMTAQREAEQAAREREIADARTAELNASRRRTIEAADAARAQLTRDLHDGAQQQFVSALLTFQLAERKAASEPLAARRLRETALELTRTGIAELRDLASGIHPGILTDRGLGPAVRALASRLPLAVSVDDASARRLPTPVEASLYFFVSEALTNVVKHARADDAWVAIGIDGDRLTVEVGDDGIGGATPTPDGTGLTGLADRIAALDGELTVSSPAGGGTRLVAEIPLD